MKVIHHWSRWLHRQAFPARRFSSRAVSMVSISLNIERSLKGESGTTSGTAESHHFLGSKDGEPRSAISAVLHVIAPRLNRLARSRINFP